MANDVNGCGSVNNSYNYNNPSLAKYDLDNDGSLSVFELENIQDSEGIELLNQDLIEQLGDDSAETNSINNVDVDLQVQSLEDKLLGIKNEQGIIGSAWNGLKSMVNIGSSTKKCEKAINDFKEGKISYQEADEIISQFQIKQQSSLNLVSNIVTGVAATAVVASAFATGGLSLGIIAAGAATGAGVKSGLKFIDRATNKVDNDALNAKQIAKDALSGAVDGAVSVATMGIGTNAVGAKTVAQKTLGQTIAKGAIKGAQAGAISGAATGASEYTIETAFDENKDFNAKELALNTLTTAAAGAVTGGVMGGVSSAIQYKTIQTKLTQEKLTARIIENEDVNQDVIIELQNQADRINKINENNIQQAKEQIETAFQGNETVETITARAKGENSTFEKLIKKFKKGQINPTQDERCFQAISDGLGTRIQMKNLTNKEALEVINKHLGQNNISYQQLMNYLNNNTLNVDDVADAALEKTAKAILNELKEKQTDEVFKSLIKGIDNESIRITELNNYGDELSSYFTNKQLQQIIDVYNKKYPTKSLDVVSLLDDTYPSAYPEIEVGGNGKTDCSNKSLPFNTKKATKESGYTSTQMNTIHKLEDGTTGLGELQIRGVEVNKFADVEHIPYDIRTGKIKAYDTHYSKIYNIINKMNNETYNLYNSYLTQVYNHLRLKELGIETAEPVIEKIMANTPLSKRALQIISRAGLEAFK